MKKKGGGGKRDQPGGLEKKNKAEKSARRGGSGSVLKGNSRKRGKEKGKDKNPRQDFKRGTFNSQ